MRSDELGYDPSPTPKLSLFSLPGRLHESPARMLTSPIHPLASVPFKWEDAPGKPRPSWMPQSDKPKIDRCLELPRRLLTKAQESTMPSPATVLDGPYVPRSLSLVKGSSFSSLKNMGTKVKTKGKTIFGSSRWGGFNKNNKQAVDPSHGGKTKVKVTRSTRRPSFIGCSHNSWVSTKLKFRR
ncbi:PREDICTED: uncharacterized protein LOC105125888 [Populus euphratica]|uniref:Uncharacterized protein LOC105125888 n=1 Tax=Populus euphratica TaxID=75702 RepID=A0AAJ6U8N8_POPEU|nr:PREDICTED: uncharacterized protein LOC105125888 [Populus euphratica]